MKGGDGVQTEPGLCYKPPSREVWVIQTGNERENGCKTGSAHDSSRDLALRAEQPGVRPSACSDLDHFSVPSPQSSQNLDDVNVKRQKVNKVQTLVFNLGWIV